MKERRRCNWEGCSKWLSSNATSKYCRYHQQRVCNIKRVERLRKEKICICCGKKPANKITCPHCHGIIKYNERCKDCKRNQNIWNKKHKEKIISSSETIH